jgi:hypothetical protein
MWQRQLAAALGAQQQRKATELGHLAADWLLLVIQQVTESARVDLLLQAVLAQKARWLLQLVLGLWLLLRVPVVLPAQLRTDLPLQQSQECLLHRSQGQQLHTSRQELQLWLRIACCQR